MYWLNGLISLCFKSTVQRMAENVCLRQQLIGLKRRRPRPHLRDSDRRFWILVCRWPGRWRETLIIVQPETVLGWHRQGWKAYWRWRSRYRGTGGRHRITPELRALIRRMACENALWGQRRIQAEPARLGFNVCARTVAKYMRQPCGGTPSPGWRRFLEQHAKDIWACDLFTVRTNWFRTLYVYFVICGAMGANGTDGMFGSHFHLWPSATDADIERIYCLLQPMATTSKSWTAGTPYGDSEVGSLGK